MSVINKIAQLFAKQQPLVNPTVPAQAIAAYNSNRSKSLKQTFCRAPSTNMLFAQDGSVRVCCHNMEHVGHYPANTIDEIWNGPGLQVARKAMENYNLQGGCGVCQNMVDLEAYEELPSRHFDSLQANKDYPVMMEFLLSNTCNLECVMCQGEYSSLIRKNREKLPALHNPYDQNFLKQLEPYLANLTEARFSGSGEAFAIDTYYNIWETLIKVNPACKIMVQSNGTYLNGRIKDILSRGNFQIGISLDSLDKETFEGIRINASHNRVLENIDYFSEYSRANNRQFLIATCVMRSNWHELPAFIEFATTKGAFNLFHQVHSPEHLSLATLPATQLQNIHTKLKGHRFNLDGPLAARNIRHYNYFVNVIDNWAIAAAERPATTDTLLSLPEYQTQMQAALSGLTNKFTNAELEQFNSKFEKVLAAHPGEREKSFLYQRSLSIPAEMLVGAMLKYPDEYLLTEAANLFKI